MFQITIGQFYSALQKLNTPQTTKTAQIISFIERVRLPLDCILLEGCSGTIFADTVQVVLGFPPTCARAVLTHVLTSSVSSSVTLFSNNFGWLCRDVTEGKKADECECVSYMYFAFSQDIGAIRLAPCCGPSKQCEIFMI